LIHLILLIFLNQMTQNCDSYDFPFQGFHDLLSI
jgi:hypothetical protein